jgi:hypothetical protein
MFLACWHHAIEGISLIERLSNIVFGKFFSNVSQIALSNSFAHMVSKPAASSPLSNHAKVSSSLFTNTLSLPQ